MENTPKFDYTFDYVIVGAGSAGCVLANRLSANPDVSVLLLEAGQKDRDPNIHIPAAFSKLFRTAHDWQYETVPQTNLNDRELYLPRGKVLGGSSSLNAMIYIRGNPQDYDRWAELGNEGWEFQEVLPYFLRSEAQERPALHNRFHGTDGPLTVGDLRSAHPLSAAFLQAAEAAGYCRNDDFNGQQLEGFGYYQVTQRRGGRASSATAFLKPVRSRRNLTVLTGAQARRVLFDGRRASGVAFQRAGQRQTACARKEVLLSGGAYNSPQLLLLSGIGDGAELAEMGIPVQQHLPGVGHNLQDHLATGVCFKTRNVTTLDTAEALPGVFSNLARYLFQRRGPFSSNVAEAGGFLRTDPTRQTPDIQLIFAPVYFINHGFEKGEGSGYTIGAILLYPESRGSVRLAGPDPSAPPRIDHNYLDAGEDLATLRRGLKIAQQLGCAPALAPFRERIFLPQQEMSSDQEFAAHIRGNSYTLYHPVGTCKMGSDPLAVVDADLRVHGTDGLRVVDASVMPEIVGGNTNAPVIMIAEKAAEKILQGDG